MGMGIPISHSRIDFIVPPSLILRLEISIADFSSTKGIETQANASGRVIVYQYQAWPDIYKLRRLKFNLNAIKSNTYKNNDYFNLTLLFLCHLKRL